MGSTDDTLRAPAPGIPARVPDVSATLQESDQGPVVVQRVPEVSATLQESDQGPVQRATGAQEAPAARGETLGRYVTLSVLGAGGMGIVYAAYDPELDRKIALKVLRRGKVSPEYSRLIREARALARLDHPNVVSVHDVGTVGNEVFIAMEFVEGQTVSAWLRERKRSVPEVLDVFIAAGRGLAAAHKANIIHRDFKPENVMVGVDGRVRVLDFGLARAEQGAAERAPADDTLVAGSPSGTELQATQDGILLGTPAYMAPEQWSGGTLTAQTDQFALAVALWEALYGQRPFRGETLPMLMSSVLEGKIDTESAGDRRVPATLRKVLERGLSSAPEKRFASLDEMLAALERTQKRGRGRMALMGLGVVGLLAGGMAGMRARQAAACEATGAEIAEVWNDQSAAALRAAVKATGVNYAETTLERAAARIDAWTGRWSALRAQACREATLEGSRSPDLYARASECLGERRDDLAGLLAVYTSPTAADVEEMVAAFAGLPALDPCVERNFLLRRPPLPEDEASRQQVASLRRELMRVQGLERAGRLGEGLREAEKLLTSVLETGYAPLAIEARFVLGSVAGRFEKFERAEEVLREVFREAGALGADDTAAAAAIQLVKIVGVGRARPEQGELWALPAEVMVQRLDQAEGLLGADLQGNEALVARFRGDYRQAIALHERALKIREELQGLDHPEVAATLSDLANAQRDGGDHAAALAALERALAIRREALGPDHPLVGGTLNNLGLLEMARGDYASAQQFLESALAIVEPALGGNSLDVATMLDNLGRVHHLRASYDEEQELLERALAIRERRLGPNNLDVAISLQNLGLLHLVRGDRLTARALLERVLAIREPQMGATTPEVLSILDSLGTVNYRIGDLEAAQALHERALAGQRQQFGARHLTVAHSLRNLALVRRARGDVDEALKLAKEALAIGEAALGPDHPDIATFLNTLGGVQRGRDAAEAVINLERALAIALRTKGPRHPATATSLQRLGEVLGDRGEHREAEEKLTQALAIREGVARESPEVADVLVSLGELARARGRAGEAVPLLERAVTIRGGGGIPGHELAEARFALARALRADRGKANERARQLAREATDYYQSAGPGFADEHAAVEAWSRAP